MNRLQSTVWVCSLIATLFSAAALCQDAEQPALTGVARIRHDAVALESLVKGELGRRFLAAANALPTIAPRVAYRDESTREWFPAARVRQMSKEVRAKLQEKPLDEDFYYNTRYGTPLAYVRPLEILELEGFKDVSGKRILDFGYGGVGQLRMLASLGADVVGVEVDTLQPALYGEPSDQGVIKGLHGSDGRLALLHGRFPADEVVTESAGEGFDLFISKNTLKNGYLHPERPVDKRMLVDLGVDEATFVRTLFRILKPGGRVMIYNLSPAPSPADKPYIPWADGRCPFPRTMWESAGFQVVQFDEDDTAAARAMGKALGWDQGEGGMNLENDLFGHYTIAVKPRGDEK